MLNLTILVDPKVLTRGEPEGFDLQVRDDRDRLLKVVQNSAQRWPNDVTSQSPGRWHVVAVAELCDADTRKLGKVVGELRFIATTKSEVWEVDNVLEAENLVRREGSTSFVVRGVMIPDVNDATQYAVTVASDGEGETPDFGWPARSAFDRVGAVRLWDTQGKRMLPLWWKEGPYGQLTIVYRAMARRNRRPGWPAVETLVGTAHGSLGNQSPLRVRRPATAVETFRSSGRVRSGPEGRSLGWVCVYYGVVLMKLPSQSKSGSRRSAVRIVAWMALIAGCATRVDAEVAGNVPAPEATQADNDRGSRTRTGSGVRAGRNRAVPADAGRSPERAGKCCGGRATVGWHGASGLGLAALLAASVHRCPVPDDEQRRLFRRRSAGLT